MNTTAAHIVKIATGEGATATPEAPARQKLAAAVELGKLGGRKGGLARAKSLTAEKRAEIARKAALARWRKKGK